MRDDSSLHPSASAAFPLGRLVVGEVGEVHVWSHLDRGADSHDDALDLLNGSERTRAARFVASRDRTAYIEHHAFLRRVLARYLDVAPADVTMHSTRHGKPEVDPAFGIMFNASYSGGLGLVVVGRDRVGVDVERMRPITDALEIAGLFAATEQDSLRRVRPAARDAAFLDVWTRKEAVVKAFGTGLSVPLDSFEVGTAPAGDPYEPWHGTFDGEPFVVAPLIAPVGWRAAVCVTGTRLDIRSMDARALEA